MAWACIVFDAAGLAASPDPAVLSDGLLIGRAGSREIGLLACSDGRRFADAVLPEPAATEPEFALDGTRAVVVTEGGQVLAYGLPSMRESGRRQLPMLATQLAVSDPAGELLAVGGIGATPLAVLDARSLADLHIYRPDGPSRVSSIGHAGVRSSFIVGFEEPAREAEIWEIAYDPNAPPVLKGLVHDYRMGEAVPLPGRFTPRVAPVPTPTLALSEGVRANEWLRLGADGVTGVLHLEVRREIARLPAPAASLSSLTAAAWLPSAWQARGARGWVLGFRGARELEVLRAGDAWRVSERIALPGGLLAMAGFAGGASIVVAVDGAVGDAVRLFRLDAESMALRPVAIPDGAATSIALPARLQRSRDGGCIALLDAAGRWIASVGRD